jgi:MFS family permease
MHPGRATGRFAGQKPMIACTKQGENGMHNPIIVILAAGLAGWVFGAIWYGVLGKAWTRAQGLNPEDCKDRKMPLGSLLTALLAACVMSAVLYQLLTNLGVMGLVPSAVAGLTIGVGFLATSTLVNNMFQQKSLMLTVIDGGHWVLAVVVEAVVISLLA